MEGSLLHLEHHCEVKETWPSHTHFKSHTSDGHKLGAAFVVGVVNLDAGATCTTRCTHRGDRRGPGAQLREASAHCNADNSIGFCSCQWLHPRPHG